jgi:RimJ/RimL family protein N-acetyltransferase
MFEGQGYGTKMAEKLIAIAAASPEVCRVIAHTSPERMHQLEFWRK